MLHLPTAATSRSGNQSWVNRQSAGWVQIQSARTRMRHLAAAIEFGRTKQVGCLKKSAPAIRVPEKIRIHGVKREPQIAFALSYFLFGGRNVGQMPGPKFLAVNVRELLFDVSKLRNLALPVQRHCPHLPISQSRTRLVCILPDSHWSVRPSWNSTSEIGPTTRVVARFPSMWCRAHVPLLPDTVGPPQRR